MTESFSALAVGFLVVDDFSFTFLHPAFDVGLVLKHFVIDRL